MQMQQLDLFAPSAWLDSTGMGQATPFSQNPFNGVPNFGRSLETQMSEDEFEPCLIGLCDAVWDDVCEIIRIRLKGSLKRKKREFSVDYFATLGWLLGYWDGLIPLELVLRCSSNNLKEKGGDSSYKSVIAMIKRHPVLADDIVVMQKKIASHKN